ncbi:Disease resistance protein RPS2 [Acorus calamus]|uniref:Disease resistance protein RPS2 n=1 Tax=Acorus calamus TaxID=4465 RepID=A0AAV9CTN9_ACOCL|nr:Disease resistance protein RPS2 [Acorus calamus]
MRHAIKILEGDRKKIKELTTKVRPIAVNKGFNLPVLKGVETLMTKLLKYVDDDAVDAVVIYGQRGVGKTTLLKSLNNRLRETGSRVAREVIYIDLSDNSPLSAIKEALRNITHLQLPLNPFSPRVVFLLNDAGENTDFKEIGIPYLNHRCKVILTAPSAKTLACIRDNYRCEGLLVPCLEESIALELFNHITSAPTLGMEKWKIAKELINHCEGLPLALTTVGKAVVDMDNWEEVSQKLKKSWWNLSTLKPNPSTGEGMMFESLSRDFKLLDDLQKKKAFLYCSLFPKGHRIDKFELVNYWIAEGILKDSDKTYGSIIINDLISKSLLQSCNNEYSVRMHSVMHGLALWMASISEEEWVMKLYVEAGVSQCTTPNATEWGKYEWMSLMKNDISLLPTKEMPDCTRLRTLLLQHNKRLFNLPVGFCNSMTSLRVLDLSHTGINVIPEDLSKMVKLQLLNLSYTMINNLSGDQLEKLVELKILNLEYTPKLDNIPLQVISSLPEMIVLNIYRSKYKMQEVEVLKKLNKLRDLGITINDEKVLPSFSNPLTEKIRYLRMENCRDLTELGAANFRYMTNLQELSICSCYDLVTLNSMMVDPINLDGFNDSEETEIKKTDLVPESRCCYSSSLINWLSIECVMYGLKTFSS